MKTKKEPPKAIPPLRRTVQIERDSFASRAESDDRIPVTLSSETPVERWFGREILDHAPESVDLGRAANGLPLLANHDTDRHIGIIEDVAIGADRKVRGLMRFSRRPEAQAMREDVLDGIVRDCSIGYQIRELTLDNSSDEEGDTYRVTRWTLLEGSLVAVPADPSVGVGRSLDETTGYGSPAPVVVRGIEKRSTCGACNKDFEGEVCPDCGVAPQGSDEAQRASCPKCGAAVADGAETCPDCGHPLTTTNDEGTAGGRTLGAPPETRSHSDAPTGRTVIVSTNTAPDGGNTRDKDLAALAREFNAHDKLAGWLESGKPVAEIRGDVLETIAKNYKGMSGPVVELNERDQRRYSIRRIIEAQAARAEGRKPAEDDGFEREISQEVEKTLPDSYERQGGTFIPTNLRSLPGMQTRAGLDSGTATKGAEVKFTEAGEFIDLLRARMKLAQLGARTLSGLVGPISFPKQTAAGTWSWVGENGGADVAESNLLLGSVALSPKTGQSTTSFSRQLIAQAAVDVESLVRNDLAMIAALGIDAAGINGTGASNQPTGILNTAGIGSVALGTNGGTIAWSNLVALETAVAAANADVGNMAYLTTPGQRGTAKTTAKAANTAVFLWGDGATPVNGYRAEVSTQVPSTLTKGTAASICHAWIFGDFSQLVFGEWGALEIIVDPLRLKKQGMIEVTTFQMVGICVRYAEAFAAIKDAL